ncbi:MAG: serine/threonine-protein kinase [Pirellulaceae bacterium]
MIDDAANSIDEESLFNQALDFNAGRERECFLNAACSGNEALKKRIMSLLDSHEKQSFILNRQTAINDLWNHSDESSSRLNGFQPGAVVDGYRLLQWLGEGGMGVVYRAEQVAPVQREVAIKIIRPGVDSGSILGRFEAERQTLALMEHPNITRVLDAGTTSDGQSYFVMELVNGTSITEFCDLHKATVRQRLELFQQVCAAIHHAHQKGIIHRDIKPSNVMVTCHEGVPVPKVIDFGIAKALERPLDETILQTQFGELIGTPQYMSPEQAEMGGVDIDVRSDVYSLGVLLYELLTGTTPLGSEQIKEKGLLKLFETIRDHESETASQRVTHINESTLSIASHRQSTPHVLGKLLKGDLDWITAKALSKDRNDRYESAAALRNDVARFLAGEPTEAAAPTLGYRAKKFIAKHKWATLLTLCLVVALFVGTGVSVYFAVQASIAQRVSDLRLLELTAEKRKSDRQRIQAEAAMKRAEIAEAEAIELGRQRQNDAVVSRAMARFVLERSPSTIQGEALKQLLDSPESMRLASSTPIITKSGAIQIERIPREPFQAKVAKNPAEDKAIGSESRTLISSSVAAVEFGLSHRRLLEITLDEQRKEFGPNDPFVAATSLQLGMQLLEEKQPSEAEAYLREALVILKNSKSIVSKDDKTLYQQVVELLIKCLEEQGKTEDADQLRTKHHVSNL